MPAHSVIVGLGGTGLSVARHLLALGRRIAVTDTRDAPPGLAELTRLAPDAPVHSGGLDAALLDGADEVVVSPGLAVAGAFFDAARARGLPIVGDIELFARARPGRVVGITGTNGKSTVTTLVAAMANAAGVAARAGGNLGPPALDLLDGMPAALYVLELSSYQLETTDSLELEAATVLNLSPDHLDRYGTMRAYAAAKARIFRRCRVAVVNADDAVVDGMDSGDARRLSFSLRAESGADYRVLRHADRWWLAQGAERLVAVDELKVTGLHNAANALAALALGAALGLERDAMLACLRGFTGLPHRAQWVGEVGGVRYVNDSKGTNVGATLAAVAGFDGPLLVIAGGDGKGQDFTPLRAAFAGKVRHVLLIGRDAGAIAAALGEAVNLQYCDSLEAAVFAAAGHALPGDTVLLSPACASLDMFRDYAHRGAVFAAAVKGLAA
jgi:UDP-N-acetylmuramoylalanine--D-glutamate ligase